MIGVILGPASTAAGANGRGGSTPLNNAAEMTQLDFAHLGKRELRRWGGERMGR